MTQLIEEHRKLNAAGLTSIRYAGQSFEYYETLVEMRQSGRLTLRVNCLIRVPGSAQPGELDEVLESWNDVPTDLVPVDPWLSVGGVKLLVDGGFEGGWMREPYAEPWGKGGTFRGIQMVPTDRYIELVRELNRRGWRIATHAVGDAAIDLVLDAYEAAHQDRSIAKRRWSIEHGFIPQPDQFPRMKALGVVVAAQNHLYLAAPSLVKYWGAERAAWVTPVKAYLDAGISVSTGSDSPVVPYQPLRTLYHFITRDTISAGVMGAHQCIDRETALRLSTQGTAYLTFEEHRKGTIEPGKLADLVILSKDILECPEEEIETMDVLLTMVGGKAVYQNPDSDLQL
jgi:predicted amidohydrolase YtcJ